MKLSTGTKTSHHYLRNTTIKKLEQTFVAESPPTNLEFECRILLQCENLVVMDVWGHKSSKSLTIMALVQSYSSCLQRRITCASNCSHSSKRCPFPSPLQAVHNKAKYAPIASTSNLMATCCQCHQLQKAPLLLCRRQHHNYVSLLLPKAYHIRLNCNTPAVHYTTNIWHVYVGYSTARLVQRCPSTH